MLATEVELKKVEKVKQYLLKHHLLHPDYLLVKEFNRLYFPLVKRTKIPDAKVLEVKFPFPEKKKPLTVEGLLKEKLTAKEIQLLPQTQEIVGKILILEIPEELQKKERVIAEAYLKASRQVETVVKKDESHQGEFRTRKVKVLAGRNTKETLHGENGVKMKVNLETTYFTARLAHERLRIAQQVKKGEEILVMFSGVAPYPLVLAKNSPAQHIYGIEINPLAHRLAVDNITLNNFQHLITVHLGDVRDLVPKLKMKFDRIAMPLPKTGEQFLDLALSKAKKGTIIHLYAFLAEDAVKAEAKKIKEIGKKFGHQLKVLRVVTCGQFAPRVFRVCFDLKVLN